MTTNQRLTGPVAVTGADGHVGRALQKRLAELPNPVIALGYSDDWKQAMTNAQSVIHLAGTLQPKRPNTYQAANVGTVQRSLDAISDGSAKRIVFLSYVGADPASSNEYLRTKGQSEELIRSSAIPHVIFRSTYVYGLRDDIGPSFSTFQTEPGGTVSMLGDGQHNVAPIFVDDLVSLILAAALDPATPTGTFDISGPEIFTLDDFVQSINPPDIKIRHLPAPVAKLLSRIMPQLTPALVDVLFNDSTAPEPAETAQRFSVDLHPTAFAHSLGGLK